MVAFPATSGLLGGNEPPDEAPGKNRLVQPPFGLPRRRSGRRNPIVTYTDVSSIGLNQLNGVTGERATAGLWGGDDTLYFGALDGSTLELYQHRLNLDGTITQLGTSQGVSGTSSAVSAQVDDRNFIKAWRIDGGSYFCYMRGEVRGDTAYGNVSDTVGVGGERYHGVYYIHPNYGVVMNQTNHPYEGAEQAYYAGATGTFVNSAKNEGDAYRHIRISRIGGPGTGRRDRFDPNQTNPRRSYCSFHYNDGGSHNGVDSDAVGIDLLHAGWDGVNGNANAITANNGAITLPEANGNSDELIHTSFGNVLIDTTLDVSDVGGGMISITWDGTTSTAGTYVPWRYRGKYAMSEFHWGMCGGSSYGSSPFLFAEYGGTDEYHTIRSYLAPNGTDVWVDTVKIKLYSDGAHFIEFVNKAVLKFEGSTVLTIGSCPLAIRGGRDLVGLHNDTGTFFHVKNAWD